MKLKYTINFRTKDKKFVILESGMVDFIFEARYKAQKYKDAYKNNCKILGEPMRKGAFVIKTKNYYK